MIAEVVHPEILPHHAMKQLATLGYAEGDRVCLRAFLPVRGEDSGRKSEFTFPEIPVDLLQQWQSEGRGIYCVVNQGGHVDAEITQCLAVFYEHDDLEKEISLALWEALNLPQPTMQIDTGGKSIHSYWVFEEPVTPHEWRSLQVDLLEYSDGDRKLKNPSRVMRLAGCRHGQTGNLAKIVAGNGKRYAFAELRSLIPASKAQAIAPTGKSWAQFNQEWRFPIADAVPLEACLSRKNRDLLASGVSEGGRSNSGFSLAADLLALTALLTQEGQRFTGDPYDLFLEYCRRCPSGGGWNQSEWDSIWKSAQSKPRNTTLTPEMVENCVKGWAWKNSGDRLNVASTLKAMPKPSESVIEGEELPEDATDEDRLRAAIATLNAAKDTGNQFKIIPLRRKIASEWSLTQSEVESLSKELDRASRSNLKPISECLDQTFSEIEARAQDHKPIGLSCGFYDLDAMTQGFQRSDLVIFAGRPSMGKTSFVLQVGRNIAHLHRKAIAIFSLEMSREQLTYRLISSECLIESGRLRSGRIHQQEWEPLSLAIASLSDLPIFVDDTPGISISEIENKTRLLQAQEGEIGAVIIDYLQLMDGTGENRVMELSRITKGLKAIAREFNCPVFALSQLSRGVESRSNKRPMMSDLRESGSIEQDADLVAMLYRDEYYNPDTVDRGVAEVLVTKHRNGPIGTVKLLFEPQFTQFKNLKGAS